MTCTRPSMDIPTANTLTFTNIETGRFNLAMRRLVWCILLCRLLRAKSYTIVNTAMHKCPMACRGLERFITIQSESLTLGVLKRFSILYFTTAKQIQLLITTLSKIERML